MSDRFRRVAELFERALALPAGERGAFVRRECGDDEALAAEVADLLRRDGDAGDFLEGGGAEARALESAAATLALPPGRTFGAWTIVRELGEGGMGVVHLAERTQDGFTQRGALKLVRSAMPSAEMIGRFVRERRILARLEHPGIARLLDGGTTEDGLPWLVMEYVEGRPLYEHCSAHALSIPERLALFLPICAAVQYAHQQLVLHRDLKPGNLLVGADGVARLLDFGIGKVFGDDGDGATRTQFAPMTPEYASPEQLRDEPVGVASDVYALGVVLYELLTGARPYPDATSRAELARLVSEHAPERPSTRVTAAPGAGANRRLPDRPAGDAASLRRRLSGDLDNIVLKAMHKDPARRYASVEQFADDLKRYLAGQPVSARPDSFRYRAGKFLLRNRVPVAAAAVAALALVTGLAVATWQAARAERERALAERRLHDVHELTRSLLFDVNDAIADLPGATRARELIVSRALAYLERLQRDAGRDPALRRDLAQAWLRLGTLQGGPWRANVGRGEDALRSFQNARALLEGLAAERPDDVDVLFDLMDACNRIALYDLDHARNDEGLAMQLRAVELNARLVRMAPDSVKYVTALPRRRHNLGLALHAAGRDSEAVATLRAGLAGFAELVARSPGDAKALSALSRASTGLGEVLRDTKAPVDSIEALARRSMAIQEALLAAHPEDLDLQRRYGSNWFLLADVAAHRLGRADSACAFARRGVERLHVAAAGDPGNADAELSEAIGLVNEGHYLALAGRDGEARERLTAQLRRFERWFAEDTTDTRMSAEIVEAHDALAEAAAVAARRSARTGARAAASWREARAHLAASSAMLARMTVSGDAWAVQRAKDDPVRALRAACDSALATTARRAPD